MDDDFFDDGWPDTGDTNEPPCDSDNTADRHEHDNNTLFGDEVLDFLIFQEITGKNRQDRNKKPAGKSGCLGIFLLTAIPFAGLLMWR